MREMKSEPLYPYHQRVSEFAAQRRRVGFLVFYGGGKSYLALRWLHDHQPESLPAIIYCPKSLIFQWGRQIEEHSTFTYKLLSSDDAKKRVATLEEPADIYVMNHDVTSSKRVFYWLYAHPGHFRSVIFDESTALKETRTQRFRRLRMLSQATPYRAILTGRPILEQAQDIFGQMLFLDDGETFGQSFLKFQTTFFSPGPPWGGQQYDWVLKDGAERAIAQRIVQKCIYIPKSEVLAQLPPKVHRLITLEMPRSLRSMYKQLKRDFALITPQGTKIETQWAVTKSLKMHELCQNFIYIDTGRAQWFEPNPKLEWLHENLPFALDVGPTLIWTSYKAQLEMYSNMCNTWGIPNRTYYGGLSQDAREDAIRAFNEGVIDCLILGQQAGCRGLNLQRACNAFFPSRTYSADQNANAEDRCHRIGSEIHKQITYYDIVYENSLDLVVLKALQTKSDVAEAILKHLVEQ